MPEFLRLYQGNKKFRICFLGYSRIVPEEKLKNIRSYPSREGEWTENKSDPELLQSVERFIGISKYFKVECAKYHIRYFDTSTDFHNSIEEAVDYLTNG